MFSVVNPQSMPRSMLCVLQLRLLLLALAAACRCCAGVCVLSVLLACGLAYWMWRDANLLGQ